MYDLHPPHIYVHKRVLNNPRALARMERMLVGLGNPDVQEVDITDTEKVVEASGASDDLPVQSNRVRMGIQKLDQDPVFIFNTYVWDQTQRQDPVRQYTNPRANMIARAMAGADPRSMHGRRDRCDGSDPRRPYVCQGGWSLHSINGCVHRCDYCGLGCAVNFMLDLEDFAQGLERTFQERPQQKLYRYDLTSDYPCFEPEYGASELLGECFARNDRYLLVYTKSDNVDHLLDLPYKEHMPCYWTLATDTQARTIERGTPTLDQRLEAMRKCHDAGYVVRAGFSPIVPHHNWRAEATTALEKLFAAAPVDTVRLWVVSMMLAGEAEQIFGAENLDPWCLEEMRRHAADMHGQHSGPFPRHVRAEIYRHYIEEIKRIAPGTPVNLCTEERALWDMLSDTLDMSPDGLYCCCGQYSVPPRTMI